MYTQFMSKIRSNTLFHKVPYFHRHKFYNFHLVRKNDKGEKWSDECECGQKRRILFNASGDCVDIKKI